MNQHMPTHQPLPKQRRRAAWLGVVGGIVAKFGTSVLLAGAAIVGGRIWAASVDAPQSWTEHMDDINSSSWFLLQAINLLGAVLGGWVSSWLSPARSLLAPGILIILALLAAFFVQLPATRSPWLLAIWALGAPVGIAIGAAIQQRHERQA